MKSSHKRKFVFGSFVYHYDLVIEKRKTMNLTVMPDLQICVKCPKEADDERIEQFLKRKWFWLEKQLNFFRKYKRKEYKKEYISGESFFYLGRQYQLIVQRGKKRDVSLRRGKLVLTTNDGVRNSKTNKQIFENWLKQRSVIIFEDRLNVVLKNFDYKFTPVITVKNMSKRWGSFMGSDRIILNKKLIRASKDCIDYVITHELCHFKQKKHNSAFYKLLSEKFPSWEKVKEKLEMKYL